MPSLSPPPTRRRRHLQDKAKNLTLLNKREKKALSMLLVKRASSNQTKAHTRKGFRKAPAPFLLTAQLRAGTQLVALARHSAPRLTSVAKTFSLCACLSNTKRGFRSL
ncbi:hypothetical protein J1N35_012360 [Gossypium stocksii]|uniref:Uncharacterized protein n=1 Tax=Gossypium stocksii TaxID=47602 RepID=A0A9D3W4H0_9ROSI|nr:hypothetical protein J1N35_012360 [Gossypium stocksii]